MSSIAELPRCAGPGSRALTAAVAALTFLLQACVATPDDDRPRAERVVNEGADSSGVPAIDTPRVESADSAEQRTLAEARVAFDARKAGFLRANSLRASENGGKVVVTFTVTPDGEVVECRIVATDFRDPAFNAAVVAEVWRLRLDQRDVPEFTYAAYPIEFSSRAEQQAVSAAASATGDSSVLPETARHAAPAGAVPSTPTVDMAAAVPPPATATAPAPPQPSAPPPPDLRAPRTTTEVQQAFGASLDAFKRIQQRYGSTLRGTIMTAFTIAPGGEVQEVRIVSSDFNDAALHAEVQAEVSKIRLGRIADKPYRYRDYPIVFVPAPHSR